MVLVGGVNFTALRKGHGCLGIAQRGKKAAQCELDLLSHAFIPSAPLTIKFSC
jgi:hypothetical protein